MQLNSISSDLGMFYIPFSLQKMFQSSNEYHKIKIALRVVQFPSEIKFVIISAITSRISEQTSK
jgi:hypothetical protein